MDPLTTLNQIFDATSADICFFDATIKSLAKEFSTLKENNKNGNANDKQFVASMLIQKYRQMTTLFLVKLLNHLVVVNNLKVPCSSCADHQTTALNATTAEPPAIVECNKLAPLNAETISAISPFLVAAAATSSLTPPGSGGNCSSDSTSLRIPSRNNCDEHQQQFADLQSNQQKLLALVQQHQQRQQQQQQQQQQQVEAIEQPRDNNESELDDGSEANFEIDEDIDEGTTDDAASTTAATIGTTSKPSLNVGIEISVDEQPLDFSRQQSVTKLPSASSAASTCDENHPPQAQRPSSAAAQTTTSSAFTQVQSQQPMISSSNASIVSSSSASSLLTPAPPMQQQQQQQQQAFLANAALGRIGLPNLLNQALNAAAAAQGGPPNPAEMLAKLGHAANAVLNATQQQQHHHHRASLSGAPIVPPVKVEGGTMLGQPNPIANFAQQLTAPNVFGNPALADIVQKFQQQQQHLQQQAQQAKPGMTEPLSLYTSASPAVGHSVSNRRASLPPYMLSNQIAQQSIHQHQNSAGLVSPGANSQSGDQSSGGHRGSSAGVRTADRYRVVYTSSQTFELEQEYRQNKFITITRKKELARQLGLNERQVKIWFQNRRAKDKRAHRRGAESASGGEATTDQPPRPSKKSKSGAIKEEYGDGGSAGSSVSSSGMLHHHDSNSNSYDGSMQAHHGGGADCDSDGDCDDSGDDMNDDDDGQDCYDAPLANNNNNNFAQQSLSKSPIPSTTLPSSMQQHLQQHQGILQALQQNPLAASFFSLMSGAQSGAAGPLMMANAATAAPTAAMEIN